MKDYVLVEFLIEHDQLRVFNEKTRTMGDDFIAYSQLFDFETEDARRWCRISGQINSAYASVIKLQDPFLSERMRVSYIPSDLKERYRR